jgi:hypothetical protein
VPAAQSVRGRVAHQFAALMPRQLGSGYQRLQHRTKQIDDLWKYVFVLRGLFVSLLYYLSHDMHCHKKGEDHYRISVRRPRITSKEWLPFEANGFLGIFSNV